jgi:hypothetical protein
MVGQTITETQKYAVERNDPQVTICYMILFMWNLNLMFAQEVHQDKSDYIIL